MLADAERRAIVIVVGRVREVTVHRVVRHHLDELRQSRRDGQDEQKGEQPLRHGLQV